jgi:anti-sigma regulatory factor (Ser/Thr protein kinase)
VTASSPDTQFSSALEFAPLPTAVSCARLHVAAVLAEQGVPANLITDAQVIVSELITNAVDASAVLPDRPSA